jgi:hypothetical protein
LDRRQDLHSLRTEHILDGRIVLVAEKREIGLFQGVPTPLRMTFEKPLDRRQVELYVDEVGYKQAIPEDVSSTLALMKSRLEK